MTLRPFALAATLALVDLAAGQGLIWPEPGPHGLGGPLPLLTQKVAVEATDGAAVTTVEQTFHNPTGARLEGYFLFPLPAEAGVTNFAMTVNGELVNAELLNADKARGIYEAIVRQQRDPGLLEYLGRGAFRARIFPIEPNEKKTIKLEYTQAVPVDDGLAKFVLPLKSRAGRAGRPPIVRPMPLPEPMPRSAAPQLERVPPRPEPEPARIGSLSIAVNLASRHGLKSIYSPTHDIDIHRDGEHRAKVGCEQSNVVPEDDFILVWQLSDALFGLDLLTHRGAGDDEGYFMLFLAPRSEIRETEIQAKDIVFVFDTSGSMSGAKIEQAKAALKYCLENLNPGDRFNVLSFSTAVDAFREEPVVAGRETIAEALAFVADLKARGGTNIDGALTAALGQLTADRQRPRMVLFLTDGLPTVGPTGEAEILQRVARVNEARARLFVFGVGHDVNVPLLDRLADDHGGTRTYVKPGQNLEVEVSGLYAKISSPVLSELRLEVKGARIADLQPARLPDLFRGSQLTVLGRYSGEGPGQVILKGVAGGREEVFEYSCDFPRRQRDNAFLPRLWATRQVGYLLDQIRLNGQKKELVDEVVRLAERYGILTPYTSYLVLEPGLKTDGLAGEMLRRRLGEPTAAGGPQVFSRPSDAASGEAAVKRSEAEGELRQAGRYRSEQATHVTRQAGARTFYLIDRTWVDSLYPRERGDRTEIRVKFASAAWFELAGLSDELREALAVGERVQTVLGNVLLVVDDDGAEELTEAQRRLLRP